ncbi:hypothetical protein KDN32_11440 [Nocardioides sp. J2M5]|uniref:hypothetical protein n=1 Tax=Nocardioides palaemonis TaxID=2829810 RepID=UPI001BAA838C|nr:hypothetical protein [Nocardioides palaemonis]MBS2938356.1 hypothetical protein [Nocardioides palaemonis]
MTPTRSAPPVRRVHVAVVLDPHGTNRSVVHAALDRPSDEPLLVDLVVLAELARSRALASVARALADPGPGEGGRALTVVD